MHVAIHGLEIVPRRVEKQTEEEGCHDDEGGRDLSDEVVRLIQGLLLGLAPFLPTTA
jgi:hypothetical protein